MTRRKIKIERYRGCTIRQRAYASGTTAWQLDVPKGKRGERDRTTHPTLEAAKEAADARAVAKINQGRGAFALDDRQRLDAADAIDVLAERTSLAEAARFWAKHHPNAKGMLFADLLKAYVAHLVQQHRRPSTIGSMRTRLGRISRDLGQLPAAAITSTDLTNCLDAAGVTGVNRKNYCIALCCLYRWAMKNKLTEVNPADKDALPRPELERDLPAILSPGTVGNILHAAERLAPKTVPFLAVAFFAGLRPLNEAGQLKWEAIDFEGGTIRVIPATAKTRRARLVTMEPNLRTWLLRYRQANGNDNVSPPHGTLIRWMQVIKRAAGITDWPKDVARHCFASAHLALHGDIQKTCLELGHTSPDMLFSHYRNLMTKEQAAAYFQIVPAVNTSDVVLQMPASA